MKNQNFSSSGEVYFFYQSVHTFSWCNFLSEKNSVCSFERQRDKMAQFFFSYSWNFHVFLWRSVCCINVHFWTISVKDWSSYFLCKWNVVIFGVCIVMIRTSTEQLLFGWSFVKYCTWQGNSKVSLRTSSRYTNNHIQESVNSFG